MKDCSLEIKRTWVGLGKDFKILGKRTKIYSFFSHTCVLGTQLEQ